MYKMIGSPFPVKVHNSAFTNDSGPRHLVDAHVVGLSMTGPTVELIVESEGCRFYDIPLRFTGPNHGRQFLPVENMGEEPQWDPEAAPRGVWAHRLPWNPSVRGTCYGAITWNKANVTFLLVVTNEGEVLLWPPHKLFFGETDKPLPAWMKRRYDDDTPHLPLTRIWDEGKEEATAHYYLAVEAIKSEDGWRSHGIGLAQKYVEGPTGPKHYRVHVWAPEAVKIGLESGIHNHRYGLRSAVIHGTLVQEEWTPTPDPAGMWERWIHGNDLNPVKTGERYSLAPRTRDIRAGQAYTFPREGYHRSVPRTSVVVTVMEREGVEGESSAMAFTGFAPVNGRTVEVPVQDMLARARKELGIR